MNFTEQYKGQLLSITHYGQNNANQSRTQRVFQPK